MGWGKWMMGVGVGMAMAVFVAQTPLGALQQGTGIQGNFVAPWWQPKPKVRTPAAAPTQKPVFQSLPAIPAIANFANQPGPQKANPFAGKPFDLVIAQCQKIESKFGRVCDEAKVIALSRSNVHILSDFMKSGISGKDVQDPSGFRDNFNKVYAMLDSQNAYVMSWMMLHDFNPQQVSAQTGGFFQQDMLNKVQSALDQQKPGTSKGDAAGSRGGPGKDVGNSGPIGGGAAPAQPGGIFWGDCLKAPVLKMPKNTSGDSGGDQGTNDTGMGRFGNSNNPSDKLKDKSFEEQCGMIDPTKKNPGGTIGTPTYTTGGASVGGTGAGSNNHDYKISGTVSVLKEIWHSDKGDIVRSVEYTYTLNVMDKDTGKNTAVTVTVAYDGDHAPPSSISVEAKEKDGSPVTVTVNPAVKPGSETGDAKPGKETDKQTPTVTQKKDGGDEGQSNPMSDSSGNSSPCEKLAQSEANNCLMDSLKAAFEKPALSPGCQGLAMKGNPGPDSTGDCGPGSGKTMGPETLDKEKIMQMTGGGYTDPKPDDQQNSQKGDDSPESKRNKKP